MRQSICKSLVTEEFLNEHSKSTNHTTLFQVQFDTVISEGNLTMSSKVDKSTILSLCNSTSRYTPRRNPYTGVERNMYKHCSIVYNGEER